jgi:hypothetical protein
VGLVVRTALFNICSALLLLLCLLCLSHRFQCPALCPCKRVESASGVRTREPKGANTLRAQLKGQQMLWRFGDSIYKRLPADRGLRVKSGKVWGIILPRKIEHTKEICRLSNDLGRKGASSTQRRSRSDQVNGVHERLLTSSLL